MKKRSLQLALFLLVSGIMLSGCIPHLGVSTPSHSGAGDFAKGAFGAGFPPLPVYQNSKVVESYASNTSFGALLISRDHLAKVIEFYDKSFGPTGWDVSFHKKSDTSYYYDVKNKDYSGQVIINTAADGKQTAITLAVAAR